MDDPTSIENQRSEDARAMGLEIRRLAHDLNNTLMPILLGVETLRKKVGDPSLERTLGNIERSATRATELADEILRVGRG